MTQLEFLNEVARCQMVTSPHIRRAQAMGFTFDWPRVVANVTGHRLLLQGRFTCACGTPEAYGIELDEMALLDREHTRELLDVGLLLYRAGSFSREHLLADGYSPEQVDEMMARARAYDEEQR